MLPLELEARAPTGSACSVLRFIRHRDVIFLDMALGLTAEKPLDDCLKDS